MNYKKKCLVNILLANSTISKRSIFIQILFIEVLVYFICGWFYMSWFEYFNNTKKNACACGKKKKKSSKIRWLHLNTKSFSFSFLARTCIFFFSLHVLFHFNFAGEAKNYVMNCISEKWVFANWSQTFNFSERIICKLDAFRHMPCRFCIHLRLGKRLHLQISLTFAFFASQIWKSQQQKEKEN